MASLQAIPPPQKPIQMRPRVPLSNTQRTPMGQTHMHKATSGLGFGFNAHQSSRQTPRAWVGHLQYKAPRKGSSLPPPPPTPPSPHSSTQQQRSALPVATPALCFVLRLCVVLWVCVQRTEHKSTTKQKTHTAVCCVHFQKTATQTKQTNAVSEVTHGCSVAVLGPAVAVAAPSRNAV